MKNLFLLFVAGFFSFFFYSFNLSEGNRNQIDKPIKKTFSTKSDDAIWYICIDCCRTKKAGKNTPWENGCRSSSSGTHNYWFCGNAGDYNMTCRNCDAEVYLSSSSSPAASKCCGSGGTHSWYHR